MPCVLQSLGTRVHAISVRSEVLNKQKYIVTAIIRYCKVLLLRIGNQQSFVQDVITVHTNNSHSISPLPLMLYLDECTNIT